MKILTPEHYRGDVMEDVEPTIVVTSITGVRFRARILREGDRYGLDDCLTWEHEDRLGVEFYDTRFPHTERGQFVSRYFAETLLDDHCRIDPGYRYGQDGCRHRAGGLDLDGGIPDWTIDSDAMDVVRAWLRLELYRVLQSEEVSA